MTISVEQSQYENALTALDSDEFSLIEKVEMLMEIAMGLQQKPKEPQQLLNAIDLYDRALAMCPQTEILLVARLHARKGTALQMVPSESEQYLVSARGELETALQTLESQGIPAEIAEAQMNLGLILQTLSAFHKAKITQAIELYQRSLRVFTAQEYPAEYAILHNNLATAFLSIPLTDERARMREALAVQSFQAALEVITLEDNPTEYAMLQNNLGNALQYVSSAHAVDNNLRALEAYDEALKVRTAKTTPLAYANTIANKANCLLNLPDDPEAPEKGNEQKTREAIALYEEAQQIFVEYREFEKAQIVAEALSRLLSE